MSLITAAFSSYAVIAFSLVVVVELVRRRLFRPPYPPGPKGLPLIGNVRDVPKKREWLSYAKWGRELSSDVIRLNLAGTSLVVLNSTEAAINLLDKRSVIYSDRPRIPMLVELMGWDVMLVYRYGDKWRSSRRLFNQSYNANAVSEFFPHIGKATHELLHRFVNDPEKFVGHIHLWAGSLILNVTYGIDVQSANNSYLKTVEAAVEVSKTAGNPGAFLVDSLPILKYIPEWFPGAGFKTKAREWRKLVEGMANDPYNYVKRQMEAGTHTPSTTSNALESMDADAGPEAEELVRVTAAVAFAGASDTIVSTMWGFVMHMVMNPDIQKKAQAEIDRVIGRDRLPEISDSPSLPYVNALIKEIFRWHPVTPLGFVHRLMEDDVYNGYFMPAGSLVLANIWAMLHDENTYKNPEKFDPERFLKDGELDPDSNFPEDVAFGFGRRICPGRHFATSAVFLTVSTMLSTLDFANAVDEKGKIIHLTGEYSSGTLCNPLPFKCSIKPRSKASAELLSHAYAIHHPE